MSQFDDLLGGLLGEKGGDVLGQVLGGLTGGSGDSARSGTPGTGDLLASLAPILGSLLGGGGLGKILGGLQANGLSAQADSWVSTGPNEAVTGAQMSDVLGSDQIAQIAEQLGIPPDQAAEALAQLLPQVVDKVSPEGQLPPESQLDELFATITDRAS